MVGEKKEEFIMLLITQFVSLKTIEYDGFFLIEPGFDTF